jgi:hypothetical protein
LFSIARYCNFGFCFTYLALDAFNEFHRLPLSLANLCLLLSVYF